MKPAGDLHELVLDEGYVFVPAAAMSAELRVDPEDWQAFAASWDDLPTPALPVLEKLADARLLIIRTDAGAKTVEAAHEEPAVRAAA